MNIPVYIWPALAGGLAVALSSLIGKLMVRYRICDAGLLTWAQGVAVAVVAGMLALATASPFPREHWHMVLATAALIIIATRFLNQALQDGDVSTVVPLMGIKIPIAALLAAVWLDEQVSYNVWIAVFLAGAALSLFGSGKQQTAQGGRGRRPGAAIALALLAALGYAASDITARKVLPFANPTALILWVNIIWAPISVCMLARPYYRQYRITRLDVVLMLVRGTLVIGAIAGLYGAFHLAGGVIVPNIAFGCQGFFALLAGWGLNRTLRLPFERQPPRIYLLRTLGTALFFTALLIVTLR